jgi:L-threonylcarbamoyladenylate synthase
MKIQRIIRGFLGNSKHYRVPNDLIAFVNSLELEKPEISGKILLGFSNHNIKKAVECMRGGGVILFFARPTYGFAASGFSKKGVAKIYEIKGRDYQKPLSVISNKKDIAKWAIISEREREIVEKIVKSYWPGNVSIILKKRLDAEGKPIIPEFVTSGLNTVNLMCMDDVALKLSKMADFPIAATSANISGQKPITDPIDGIRKFGGAVDLMLLGPRSDVGVNTTIVDLTVEPPRLVREGPVPFEELKNIMPNLQK